MTAKDWWNNLTPAQRLEVARTAGLMHRTADAERLWALGWDELMSFSQQKELQRYHYEVIKAAAGD
jgi:hypothetical protein